MISLDTETTGLDLRHGARPFLITLCDEAGTNTWWEWNVDPVTRKVIALKSDLLDIQARIDAADSIIGQNSKFDFVALQLLFQDYGLELRWDWGKVHDTLLAGHLLASNQPHDLTTMSLVYLDVNIQSYESDLTAVVKDARMLVKREHRKWRLAHAALPEMPTISRIKGGVIRSDYWVPRAVAEQHGFNPEHRWRHVLAEYGNMDSAVTLPLFQKQRELLKERGYWQIYEARRKLQPIVPAMEGWGITISKERLETVRGQFAEEAKLNHRLCVNLSGHEIEELPTGGTSNALKHVVYNVFKLKSNKTTKKGNASMDRSVLEHWVATSPVHSKASKFVENLLAYRKRMTAMSYMDSYARFWVPLPGFSRVNSTGQTEFLWYRLHPSLNCTGTDTLRWSSSSPNEQNISRQPGFNIRFCFGPAPGREWYSMDASNIELRIPAYEAGETEMIALFERPNDPPYFGGVHALMFHTVYPKEFEASASRNWDLKTVYPNLYTRVKNGDFAVQYGSVEQSGTADRSYGVAGAFAKVKQRFKRIHGSGGLNEQMISFAQRHGYVETMPDKTVDPERGYPLYCTRATYGQILPTVPLNYHVQGSACWWMMKAMIRCYDYLQTLGSEYRMVMQVHDELVFDFPAGREENLDKINHLKQLMEQGGDDLGLPTPVKVEYHPQNWSESEHVTSKPKEENKGYNESPVVVQPLLPRKEPKLRLHKYQISILQCLARSARPMPGLLLSKRLKINSANITGFAGPQSAAQVETEWPFPALDSLGYVTVEMHDINGRDVRLYTITPHGRKYLS